MKQFECKVKRSYRFLKGQVDRLKRKMIARNYFFVGSENNFRLILPGLIISAISHVLIVMIFVYSPVRQLDKRIMPVPINVSLVSVSLPYGQYPKKEKSEAKTLNKSVPQKPKENASKRTPEVKIAEIIKPTPKISHKKKMFKTGKVVEKVPKEKELEDGRAGSLAKTLEPVNEKPGQNPSDEAQNQRDASDGEGMSGGGGGGGGHPDGSQVYETGDIDHPLTVLTRAPPLYPKYARRMGIEGSVEVKLMVSEDGLVKNIEIITSEPKGVFENTVIQCLSSWRFLPGTIAGVPVKAYVTTTIRFNLENE